VNADGLVGFDIAPGTGIAYAAMRPASMNSHLYRIDLTTGVAQLDGPIGLGLSVRCLAAAAGPENVFAVTTGNRLLRFLSGAPGAIISKSPITGLQPGETVVGIDFRPADGLLYGVGSTSRLYRIDVATGGATQVGTGPFPTLLSGTDFGVDFDPRPEEDHLRVVSDAEQNLRIDPRDGAVVVDPSLSPAGHVVAAAYSDNFAGTTMTRLYHIDTSSGLLLTQMPPGSGALSAVGPLGRPTTALVGLDIAPNGMAFASLTAPGASTSGFHAVDLASGVATLLGTIGGGETIRDLAVRVHAEVIYALTHSGATFPLISFNAATPGRLLSSVDLTGLQPGESLVGIDFRPVTGRLYGIGTTSRLYTIDTGTGVATAVGGPFTPALNGINFGVDFDPRVDSLRVVSDAEQNLRIDPDTGTVNFIGGALNPPGNVTGLAYSSNFVRPDTTTLYDVDLSTRQLFTQNPNLGDLVLVGSLHPGINGSFEAGFDISSASGKAYLSAYEGPSVPFTPTLYTVNLQTGAATPIHPIGTSALVMDIAVALTPATFGFDTPGVFVPSSSVWFLRNATSAGPADVAFKYGTGGANLVPIRGDWDGDGDDTPGLYDRTTGRFFLRNSSSAGPAEVPPFAFGPGGASFLPIAGDWDGDGVDTVGLRNTATGEVFLKNTNAAGAADLAFVFGAPGGIPIAGDWNNDGIDTIGLYVPATATFFLHNAHAGGVSDFLPFTFGAPGLAPLAGDWNGDGVDSIGVHDSATASWFLANRFTGGAADVTFTYGPPGAIGLAGDWDRR
jgi:hypothetical protein